MIILLFVIHVAIAMSLVGVILLQKSEGGALGMGGGGMSGFMTGRSTANLLTRTTAILAAAFFATSVLLVVLSNRTQPPGSMLDQGSPLDAGDASVPAAPAAPAPPAGAGRSARQGAAGARLESAARAIWTAATPRRFVSATLIGSRRQLNAVDNLRFWPQFDFAYGSPRVSRVTAARLLYIEGP